MKRNALLFRNQVKETGSGGELVWKECRRWSWLGGGLQRAMQSARGILVAFQSQAEAGVDSVGTLHGAQCGAQVLTFSSSLSLVISPMQSGKGVEHEQNCCAKARLT